jgi:hypothetical protein
MVKMYDRQSLKQEARAIVDAVADRKADPRNTFLPVPELMYWNIASQLNGQRNLLDREIRAAARPKGMDGFQLVEYLNQGYENYLAQAKAIGDLNGVGNDEAETNRRLDNITRIYLAGCVKPADLTPEEIKALKIDSSFAEGAEERLAEFFAGD